MDEEQIIVLLGANEKAHLHIEDRDVTFSKNLIGSSIAYLSFDDIENIYNIIQKLK